MKKTKLSKKKKKPAARVDSRSSTYVRREIPAPSRKTTADRKQTRREIDAELHREEFAELDAEIAKLGNALIERCHPTDRPVLRNAFDAPPIGVRGQADQAKRLRDLRRALRLLGRL
jgi:hypothetical protein